MIFAFVATMSFLAPNVEDACSATLKCGRSVGGDTIICTGDISCTAGKGYVECVSAAGISRVTFGRYLF